MPEETKPAAAPTPAAPVVTVRPPAPARAVPPRPIAPVVKRVDVLKKEYDALASEVRVTNPADKDYIALRAKKRAAHEAYWAELQKPGK